MNYYKKIAPNILKFIFDLGIVPFRSKILSVLSPRNLYKEGEFTVRKKIWYDIELDLDLSYYIERQVFYYNIYEPDVISFISSAVNENMKCLDLGTNIGLHSIVMSKKAKEVVSYEANPKVIQRLNNNIRINNVKNITVVNRAISTSDGEIDFYVPIDNAFSMDGAIGHTTEGVKSSQIKIKADSLQRVLVEQGRFDLIKIDVEGLEFELIESAIDILTQQKSTLIFEYNSVTWKESEFNPKRLLEFFEKREYAVVEIKEKYRKSSVPITPELLPFPSQNLFLVNVVALHKKGEMYQDLKIKKLI